MIAKLMAEHPKLVDLYDQVSPNPDVSEVDACTQLIRDHHLTFIVAMGGGSTMDLAKVSATMALTEESVVAYHGTGKVLPKTHLPLIAIPTTAGTGSEVTCAAVLTNRELGKKAPLNSDNFYPKDALIDPTLTYKIPPQVTANTGMDVLCHALEGLWSKGHQPICDALALRACKLVFAYLERAYHHPDDHEAREAMCEASLLAGMAFSIPKTTSSHACSFPLTNIYGIPHGEACALTIDYFALINKDVEGQRLEKFVKEIGFASVEEMVTKIRDMKKDMHMRLDLKEFELSEEQLNDLVCLSHHPNLYNNPVEITDEMLYRLYRGMM
jgi:alcohol dehydrogenase